jgi:arsenite-transporting ATPase
MREKHRVMEEALRGAWRPAVEDALVNEMADTARSLAGLLRDPHRSRVSWATLPEPMAIAETADAVRVLSEAEIRVAALIVNRLTPPPPSRCGHCDARRIYEASALAGLPPAHDVQHVHALDTEPRGIRTLGTVAADLTRPAAAAVLAKGPRRWQSRLDGVRLDPAELLDPSLRLVLAGGKGGVGKTTAAAALALAAAKRWPDRRVLLISADPAHSLADVFGAEMSNEARSLPGAPASLRVRELDAAVVFAGIRDRYVAAIDKVFDRLSRGSAFDAAHDRSVMRGLIDLAPPGLDELAAVLEITDALTGAEPEWDLVVMDTAPTGHALRLLEMPGLIQDWTRALMRILLKYQGVARVGDLGVLLLKLSKGLGTLRELLVDPRRAAFVVVTQPAILPRLETDRLLRRLTRLRIHVAAVVINAVGRGDCARCLKAHTAQQREIAATRRAATSQSITRVVRTETRIPAPRGPSDLHDWARTGWRSGKGKG